MTPSFGQKFLEHFCSESLTPPIITRAIGVWLGTLEQAMVTNNPSNAIVDNLAALSNTNAWLFGVNPITADDMWAWVVAWDEANPKDRTTVTAGGWDDPVVVTEPDLTPGNDKLVWLRTHPAFTIGAWKGTWRASSLSYEDELHSYRWHPNQENDRGRVQQVWRWNPLKMKQPNGRPVSLYFQPKSQHLSKVSVKPHLEQRRRDKVFEILKTKVLAGITQVKAEEVALLYYGRKVNTSSTLQRIRRTLTEVGWEYNIYDKVWRPTAEFLTRITT